MSNLFLTLVIAFILIVFAIALMAIGWLVTGKTKLQKGGCGKNPHASKNENCGTGASCDLCKREEFDTSENEGENKSS